MSQTKLDETYYDILKVDSQATITEIVAAYHAAKNAFSRDSVATYSLFSPEEVESVLQKLEEAFVHLSNIDKKREYDRLLAARARNDEMPPSMTELERKQNAQLLPKPSSSPSEPPVAGVSTAPPAAAQADLAPFPSDRITGPILKEIREKRALSQEDVCRITKIPLKFVQAIEADDLKRLPARVYLQGFVKNLAALFRLDPKVASKTYLDYVDGMQKSLESPKA